MAKSYRTTITIPADLKARMDAIEEEVNWSAVAARAFEAKLAEIISSREVKDIEEVVTRLRVSRRNVDHSLATAGHLDGARWASLRANVNQLANLEAFMNGSSLDSVFDPDSKSPFSVADHVYMAINGVRPEEFNREAADLFWRPIVASKNKDLLMNQNYVFGVMDGATGVWRTVKDRI